MARLISVWIALVLFSLPAAAQSVGTVRVTRAAVVLQQPRGDSAVVATVPPGVVLEVFGQQGDWYSVAVPGDSTGSTRPTGWIQQEAVEFLTGQVPRGGPAAAGQNTLRPLPGPTTGRRLMQTGLFELMLQGSFVGVSSGGRTESSIRADATLGYFVTPSLEVGGVASVLKPAGLGGVGSLGGLFAFNFAGDSLVVPFIGTAAGGGLGYGSVTGNPFWIDLFGGFRIVMPGGGGAFVVRPFYQRQFFSSDSPRVQDINLFGVAVGASLLF